MRKSCNYKDVKKNKYKRITCTPVSIAAAPVVVTMPTHIHPIQ